MFVNAFKSAINLKLILGSSWNLIPRFTEVLTELFPHHTKQRSKVQQRLTSYADRQIGARTLL